jgi:hypothetical protein
MITIKAQFSKPTAFSLIIAYFLCLPRENESKERASGMPFSLRASKVACS